MSCHKEKNDVKWLVVLPHLVVAITLSLEWIEDSPLEREKTMNDWLDLVSAIGYHAL